MRIRKRLILFVLAACSTFFLGVFLSRFAPDFVKKDEPSPWLVLLSYENQDLEGLDDQSVHTVQAAIEMLTGRVNQDRYPQFGPRLFRRITNTKGTRRYILVEEAPLMFIPGDSKLRVHVFDAAGKLLSGEEFSAGYRTVLTGIQIRRIYGVNEEALVVNGEYCLGGHPSHQYYVLVENQLRLIYLEHDGRYDRNNYQDWNMTIGPKIHRSADEWEKALWSEDKAEVMSALIWLGGYHWNGQPAPYDEDKCEAEKVSNLRLRDGVRKRLAELGQSTDLWMKYAAESITTND